jgi:hypothetical protein
MISTFSQMTRRENMRATQGNSSKLQGIAFDQRESEVNLHKATSSPESPLKVSPGLDIKVKR